MLKLLALCGVAAIAAGYAMLTPGTGMPCFVSGAATFQIVRDANASDFRVHIARDTAKPDLRMQLVDRPELADFVLVDEPGADGGTPCPRATPIRKVALDDGSASPDVMVRLSSDTAADYRLYVRSARFSEQEAAALLAAIWQSDRRGEVTGSIARR